MGDYKDSPLGRQDAVYTHDEGDGTFSRASAGHNRGWDATDGAWYRLPVDHATGALLVKATLAAGSVDVGSVDQGTGGSSAWLISGAVTASQTGTWGVSISNSPSVAVTSGSIAISNSPSVSVTSGSVTANQGTSPWVVGGGTASGAANAGNPVKAGAVFNAAAPTFTDGQIAELQVNNKGILKTLLVSQNDGVTAAGIPTAGDNQVNQAGLATVALNSMWDPAGQRWNRVYGDTTSGAWVQTKSEVATAADGTTTQPTVAKVIGGWDGLAVRAATVKAYNGFNQLFVRDQALAGLLSEILMELKISNSYEEVVT